MSFRQKTVGGGVKDPSFFEGDGTAAPPSLKALSVDRLIARTVNRDVLFAAHGFNVSFAAGACAERNGEPAYNATPSKAVTMVVLTRFI